MVVAGVGPEGLQPCGQRCFDIRSVKEAEIFLCGGGRLVLWVALATPDGEGHRADRERECRYPPRA